MKNKAAGRFTSRMLVGCVAAGFLGHYLDDKFSTTPWILLVLLFYVIGGSFYLLMKEIGDEDGK